MPFYDYQCIVCANKVPHYRKIAERDDFPAHCDQAMRRVISAPAVKVDILAYVSPTSGKWINSRSAQKEDLLATGSILNEPGLREDIASVQASEKEKIAQRLDATVDSTVSAMHACNLI